VAADRFSYVATSAPYHTLASPQRLLDTSAKGSGGPLLAGHTRELVIAGVGPIPTNATAVLLHVTFHARSVRSNLTLFPEGARRPTRADLSAGAGQTVTKNIEVRIGSHGSISIYNSGGNANLVVVAEGYYLPTKATAAIHSRSEGVIRP
jgi:hypothetical protein